jgi:hypothetical protein
MDALLEGRCVNALCIGVPASWMADCPQQAACAHVFCVSVHAHHWCRTGEYHGTIYNSPYSDRRVAVGEFRPNGYIVATQPTIINQLTVVVNIPSRATQLSRPTPDQACADAMSYVLELNLTRRPCGIFRTFHG